MKVSKSEQSVMVTGDVVVLVAGQGWDAGQEYVLLIQRRKQPYQGWWALPGGKLKPGMESTEECALRELAEETGIDSVALTRLVGVYSAPDRDPRGHFISITYVVRLPQFPWVAAGDDAAEAAWFPLSDLPALAFDHTTAVWDAVAALGLRVPQQPYQELQYE